MTEYILQGYDKPSDVPIDEVDLSATCLPGYFFNAAGAGSIYAGSSRPMEYCPNLMSQRCGTDGKWDQNCQSYFDSLSKPSKDRFMKMIAQIKYCVLSKDPTNKNCTIMCEKANPMSADGSNMCTIVGNANWRFPSNGDSIHPTAPPPINEYKKMEGELNFRGSFQDVGNYNPIQIQPVMIGACGLTCNQIDQIDNNDFVMNYIVTSNCANDILVLLARELISKNLKSKNDNFQKWIDTNMVILNQMGIVAPSTAAPKIEPFNMIPMKAAINEDMPEGNGYYIAIGGVALLIAIFIIYYYYFRNCVNCK